MVAIERSTLEWAMNVNESDVFEALGRVLADGAGRFPPSRWSSLGREWFDSLEANYKALICHNLLAVTAEDSDPITAAYTAAVLSAEELVPGGAFTPLSIAYVVALIARKLVLGYCAD